MKNLVKNIFYLLIFVPVAIQAMEGSDQEIKSEQAALTVLGLPIDLNIKDTATWESIQKIKEALAKEIKAKLSERYKQEIESKNNPVLKSSLAESEEEFYKKNLERLNSIEKAYGYLWRKSLNINN